MGFDDKRIELGQGDQSEAPEEMPSLELLNDHSGRESESASTVASFEPTTPHETLVAGHSTETRSRIKETTHKPRAPKVRAYIQIILDEAKAAVDVKDQTKWQNMILRKLCGESALDIPLSPKEWELDKPKTRSDFLHHLRDTLEAIWGHEIIKFLPNFIQTPPFQKKENPSKSTKSGRTFCNSPHLTNIKK